MTVESSQSRSPEAPLELPIRGRRVRRVRGDERERAILETFERLLEHRPFHEISIDELARGAGISRPTFYFYFPSKEAVLLTLLDRVIGEANRRRDVAVQLFAEDPGVGLREVIKAFFDAFGSHRAVTLAGAEARTTNAEVRELWSQVMEGWVQYGAAVIEAERERGAAPPGPPSRELAIALIYMNERVMYTSLSGEPPAVGEADVIDVLITIWLKAIYGDAPNPG
jgi:AcrR family transcriptional regulator